MPYDPNRFSPGARLHIWAAPIILQVRDFVRDCTADIPLLTRIASHVGLLALIVLTIAASSLRFGDAKIAAADSPDEESPFLENDTGDDALLFGSPNPFTTIPQRTRRDIVKYTVESGDTVSGIADQFGVTADSILWANAKLEDNPDMLALGPVLNIPPTSGVLYTVQKNDTVQKIAGQFKSKKVTADQLVQNIVKFEFNQELHDLKGPDYILTTGQYLMVPDGSKPYVARVVTVYSGAVPVTAARGTGNFGWPTSGRITQQYGVARHTGLDIGAPKGTRVAAADSGFVTYVGCVPTGYGCSIMINHGNGYVTRYAHLSAFNVEARDSVKKGQVIGYVGSTGHSTGPHLHFEIIQNGKFRNPVGMLPGR